MVHGRVDVDGQPVPWLEVRSGSMMNVGTTNAGPGVGQSTVFDGRRWMVWLVRTSQSAPDLLAPHPPPHLPPGPPSVAVSWPTGPEQVVLDVVVLPGDPTTGMVGGCGADIVFAPPGSRRPAAAWNADYAAGRFRPVPTARLRCSRPGED